MLGGGSVSLRTLCLASASGSLWIVILDLSTAEQEGGSSIESTLTSQTRLTMRIPVRILDDVEV